MKDNKPKKQYDNVQKEYRCNRCEQLWLKGHINTCEWYKELKEIRGVK